MNDRQRKVLLAVAATIVAMLLFPPFRLVMVGGGLKSLGYGWLFDPPQQWASVDLGLLFTQWAAVLMVGAIAYFLFKK